MDVFEFCFLKHYSEGDEMKVYGAGLLSSAAELEFVMNGSKVKLMIRMMKVIRTTILNF